MTSEEDRIRYKLKGVAMNEFQNESTERKKMKEREAAQTEYDKRPIIDRRIAKICQKHRRTLESVSKEPT